MFGGKGVETSCVHAQKMVLWELNLLRIFGCCSREMGDDEVKRI